MRKHLTILCVAFSLLSMSGQRPDFSDIIASLQRQGCLNANVKYQVYLPTSADPVEYTITLRTHNVPDSLSPCDYLITWQLPRNQKVSSGFNSYFDGDHYRYRDTRLQEYHFAENPQSFTVSGGGVQRTSQFADLLPAFIAEKLSEMQSDTTYVSERKDFTVSGVQRIKGYDAVEYTYRFNPQNGLPESIDFVFNPAGISEQTVTATYTWIEGDCPEFTEEYLMERFPDEFARFRQSNFRAENLRDTDFPAFSYTDATGQRFTHTRGEADLDAPLLVVFVNSQNANAAEIIELAQNVVSQIPLVVKPIYAFANNDVPEALKSSRNIVNGAEGLIRKCGVADFPTFILVNAAGNVADVIIGTTPDISTRLQQSLILL